MAFTLQYGHTCTRLQRSFSLSLSLSRAATKKPQERPSACKCFPLASGPSSLNDAAAASRCRNVWLDAARRVTARARPRSRLRAPRMNGRARALSLHVAGKRMRSGERTVVPSVPRVRAGFFGRSVQGLARSPRIA